MDIMKLADELLLEPFREQVKTQRGSCDCCGKRPWKYKGVHYGIDTAFCWECAGETAEEQDEDT